MQIYKILLTFCERRQLPDNYTLDKNNVFPKKLYKSNFRKYNLGNETLYMFSYFIRTALEQQLDESINITDKLTVSLSRNKYYSERKYYKHINILESNYVIMRLNKRSSEYIVNPDYLAYKNPDDIRMINNFFLPKARELALSNAL